MVYSSVLSVNMFTLNVFLVFFSTFTLSYSQVSLRGYDNPFSKELLLKISELIDEDDTNSTICKMQLEKWKQSLDEPWAQQMLDASGKLPSGILIGNTYELGQFDQCIRINALPKNSDLTVKGKYCTAVWPILNNVTLPSVNMFDLMRENNILPGQTGIERSEDNENVRGVSLKLTLGICFPASCKSSQIESALNKLYKNSVSSKKRWLNMSPDHLCSTGEPIPLTDGDWGAIAVLLYFGILLVSSTVYDIIIHILQERGKKIEKNRYLVSFSVWTNTVKLMKNSANPGPLSSLHGIRVLSMFWVIMCHRYSTVLRIPPTNYMDVIAWSQSYWNMYVISGTVSVDTFFLLSGLLLSYTFFKKIGNKKSFNIFIFYLHRFLRLTPAMAMMILLQATLYKHIGDGPVWKSNSGYTIEPCQRNWWVSLLYVQNYVRTQEMCLGQTWYLAADMHLYLLSPILLYPIMRNAKIGMILAACWTLISIITVTVLCYVYGWAAASVPLNGKRDETAARKAIYYYPTHARATPWLIGFVAGYFFMTSVKRNIRLNKYLVLFCWAASLAVMGAVVYGMGPLQLKTHVVSHLEDSTYLAFSRTAWSLSVLWVIFACSHGYGGPVNWFLSWKMWEILGRLSFTMYLVHLNVQLVIVDSARAVSRFSNLKTMHLFLGDTIVTLLVAYCLAITVEIPCMMLEKALFSKGDKTVKPEPRKSIQTEKE